MGKIKDLSAHLLSVIHETIDLFEVSVELQCRQDQTRLYFESGECVTIVPVLEDSKARGIHGQLDGLDEYELAELIERAARGGYERVYINISKGA